MPFGDASPLTPPVFWRTTRATQRPEPIGIGRSAKGSRRRADPPPHPPEIGNREMDACRRHWLTRQ